MAAAICLVSCGDKKAMQERLKTAEAESAATQAEYEKTSKKFAEMHQNNLEMEKLLFTQVEDPAAKKKKGGPPPKRLTVDTASEILRSKNASLAQQKEELEQQCQIAEKELAVYRARFSK